MSTAQGIYNIDNFPIVPKISFMGQGFTSTYLLTELSPSCEAASCAATQELPSNFKEPEGSSPCSQEPSICPYPEPDPSSPYPPILRAILIFSTHLRLGLPSGLFPSGFPTNILYAFLVSPIRPTCLSCVSITILCVCV
jgi:hypothetical protein